MIHDIVQERILIRNLATVYDVAYTIGYAAANPHIDMWHYEHKSWCNNRHRWAALEQGRASVLFTRGYVRGWANGLAREIAAYAG